MAGARKEYTTHMGNLAMLSSAKSRQISPENITGEKGKAASATKGTGANGARQLGIGWKISPSFRLEAGDSLNLANIEGPGVIQHIWMTPTGDWRHCILRVYWDDQDIPSIEVPIGAFFACGWNTYAQVTSLPVCVNPGSSFNCYWPMPFRKRCKIVLTNESVAAIQVYYTVDYASVEIPDDAAYFHAQFRRANPVPYAQPYVILDNVTGAGHYVGTYMMLSPHSSAWWGEGEVKFFIDGDDRFPTLCSTGTEDYFGGSYDFVNKHTGEYQVFTTPYAGLPQVILPDGKYESEMRFGMYRWHIVDPVRFEYDLKVTAQDLGWNNDGRYIPRQDDIATVAYWYQTLPTPPFPPFPDYDQRALIRELHPQ